MKMGKLVNKIIKENEKLNEILARYEEQNEVLNTSIDEFIHHIAKTDIRKTKVKDEDGKYKIEEQVYRYIEYTTYFDSIDDNCNVIEKIPMNLKIYIQSGGMFHDIDYEYIMELINKKQLIF